MEPKYHDAASDLPVQKILQILHETVLVPKSGQRIETAFVFCDCSAEISWLPGSRVSNDRAQAGAGDIAPGFVLDPILNAMAFPSENGLDTVLVDSTVFRVNSIFPDFFGILQVFSGQAKIVYGRFGPPGTVVFQIAKIDKGSRNDYLIG